MARFNAVSARLGRHASKAHRKVVLQRCEELNMGLREQLIDSIAAEDAVGHAIHAVYMAVADLDRLRMKNETADLVLRESDQISGASQMLQDLAEDIAQSLYKRAAE
jgi:hypothetical protein